MSLSLTGLGGFGPSAACISPKEATYRWPDQESDGLSCLYRGRTVPRTILITSGLKPAWYASRPQPLAPQ